ncbi:MAG: alpha,alpha-trehalose-phosphate synthase (UDP-forming) [Stellaceae bacterium]
MARLVIVSNRVAPPRDRGARAGGLAVAMADALDQYGGLWFGWSGDVADDPGPNPTLIETGNVTYVTIDLSERDYREYYIGYANGALWPLFHYRLGLVNYSRIAFDGYMRVNAKFAELLAPMIQPDDTIWVHDYHLIPLGAELRRRGVRNRIGFFLHTPFPPRQLLETLPRQIVLLQALAAYDLVGFQTDEALRGFQDSVAELANGRVLADGEFAIGDRHSRAGAYPIGIDTERFAKLARRTARSRDSTRLKESLVGRALIIGVDRLDYSKGIPNRFEAINTLLGEYPEDRTEFSFLQIAPHSRGDVAQYRALRRELEAAVGAINGRFAEYDWTPLRYVNRTFSRLVLAGFYRLARIGLVTPLRDGMNLVAKEFVAAQDPENPGVLVLSRFAGAAQELKTAIQVNPYDVDDIASAIHRALHMPLDERVTRWSHMMDVITRTTVTTWREDFLAALKEGPSHSA